jgi:hypothetical protein
MPAMSARPHGRCRDPVQVFHTGVRNRLIMITSAKYRPHDATIRLIECRRTGLRIRRRNARVTLRSASNAVPRCGFLPLHQSTPTAVQGIHGPRGALTKSPERFNAHSAVVVPRFSPIRF